MPSQNAKPKHLKERRILRCVTMAALGLFALSSCADAGSSSAASQASGEVTPLRLADDYAPAHPFVEYGASVFIDEAEASGVPIDYFPAAQMGTPEDLAVLLETEVLDAGSTAPAYLESKFPLSSVSDLPSDVSDSCVAANAMMDLLGEDGILYQEEFKPRGLRPLWVAVLPGYELQTATKRVETPEDVQGLLIRSAGGALDASTDHIGAQAVSMPGGDAYEAMARHTVDGVGFTYISANQYGLQDVAAYSTDGLNMGSFVLPYVITEDAWKNLTPTQQDSVSRAAETANATLCEGVNEETAKAKQEMAAGGLEYVSIEGENAQAWEEVLADIRADWASSMDDAGMPGSDVLEAYNEAVTKYE